MLLNILLYLVVHHHKIVEVLDLGTLYHYGFTYMHVLCFCPADHKTALKPPCCSGGIVDDISLDYAHTKIPLQKTYKKLYISSYVPFLVQRVRFRW